MLWILLLKNLKDLNPNMDFEQFKAQYPWANPAVGAVQGGGYKVKRKKKYQNTLQKRTQRKRTQRRRKQQRRTKHKRTQHRRTKR